MASHIKKLLFSFFIIFLLFVQVFAEVPVDNVEGEEMLVFHKTHRHSKINCHVACGRRCKKSSRKKICRRACGTCCKRCKCVPPGTYGNTWACPCYASLRTHGGKPKCP